MALSACEVHYGEGPKPDTAETTQANMANPAPGYCVQNRNKLEIQTDADSSQSRICIYPDGSACD